MSFENVAARYARDSTAQRSAATLLLALAEVRGDEDVLDVGCGTGALVARLRAMTRGRVVGVDPSPAMLDAARAEVPEGIDLLRCAAEELPHCSEFDLAVSNSALQWFSDPLAALIRIRRALRPGGRAVVQAPATRLYCPEFVAALDEVARDPRTREVFATWRSPWRWLESAAEYAALLRSAGFEVTRARIDELVSRETPESAMRIFGSGAEAGYLGARYYPAPLPHGYAATLRAIVRASLERSVGPDGRLELRFRRVFLAGG